MVEAGNVDILAMDTSRGLNVIYRLMTQNKDEADVKKIKRDLQLTAVDSWDVKANSKSAEPIVPTVDPGVAKMMALMSGNFKGPVMPVALPVPPT